MSFKPLRTMIPMKDISRMYDDIGSEYLAFPKQYKNPTYCNRLQMGHEPSNKSAVIDRPSSVKCVCRRKWRGIKCINAYYAFIASDDTVETVEGKTLLP